MLNMNDIDEMDDVERYALLIAGMSGVSKAKILSLAKKKAKREGEKDLLYILRIWESLAACNCFNYDNLCKLYA